jgi:hypothetical protein
VRPALAQEAKVVIRRRLPAEARCAQHGPGLFLRPWALCSITSEDIMKRERKEYRRPYGRGHYELHRGGAGVYWQAGDGVVVRLAAPERHLDALPHTEPEIVSVEDVPLRFAR